MATKTEERSKNDNNVIKFEEVPNQFLTKNRVKVSDIKEKMLLSPSDSRGLDDTITSLAEEFENPFRGTIVIK